jgi:hypothetical protein
MSETYQVTPRKELRANDLAEFMRLAIADGVVNFDFGPQILDDFEAKAPDLAEPDMDPSSVRIDLPEFTKELPNGCRSSVGLSSVALLLGEILAAHQLNERWRPEESAAFASCLFNTRLVTLHLAISHAYCEEEKLREDRLRNPEDGIVARARSDFTARVAQLKRLGMAISPPKRRSLSMEITDAQGRTKSISATRTPDGKLVGTITKRIVAERKPDGRFTAEIKG